MSIRGRVTNGVIVLEPGFVLPEGTEVEVDPIEEGAEAPSEDDPLSRMGELAVDTGIPDLAGNIDHYLYGHPKVDEAK